MAPGVNDGQRNTGTLPKSNRRNNRNREVPGVNQQPPSRSVYHGRTQHSNNLVQRQFSWIRVFCLSGPSGLDDI